MKRKSLAVIVCLAVLVISAGAWSAEGTSSLATVNAVKGDVQVGLEGQWRPAAVGDALAEGEVLKTGPASGATILFEGDLKADVGEGAEIALSDLLLKTRLEKMKSTISEPTDTEKVEMKVTPTAGVRGTEQTEEKSEELKREHYWNKDAEKTE